MRVVVGDDQERIAVTVSGARDWAARAGAPGTKSTRAARAVTSARIRIIDPALWGSGRPRACGADRTDPGDRPLVGEPQRDELRLLVPAVNEQHGVDRKSTRLNSSH